MREFDECKDQIVRVFEKAGDKGVRINIPSDYVVAKKPSNSNINVEDQPMSGRDPNSRQNVHASGENVISNSGAKVMSELHESKESAAISKMNSIDEH